MPEFGPGSAIPAGASKTATATAVAESSRPARIVSIDALRAFVMFTMIFVNDLSGVSNRIVPPWMKHYRGRNGMTFVDLVFPAFLFIVGMSIPFALGGRLAKGEPLWKTILHVITRAASLILLGVMMVNAESSTLRPRGWHLPPGVSSSELWITLMFVSGILAFCSIMPPGELSAAKKRLFSIITGSLRVIGFAGLAYLAVIYHNRDGGRIIIFSPFSINTDWYGILGLIGWAYLVGAISYLLFRTNRTALLGCAVLLTCFFPADKKGVFDNFWLGNYVGMGDTLGSQAAITVAGVLLASILADPKAITTWARTKFTLLFAGGFAAGAWLVQGLYGISKNNATPSWCLWSCAITGVLWLLFYYLADARPNSAGSKIAEPLRIAGQNVLLAYLISEMFPEFLSLVHWDDWYDQLARPDLLHAVTRSAACAVFILLITVCLNKVGFKLRV
jgi:heparan-alpha-glucosaminide N-acetyltransferase